MSLTLPEFWYPFYVYYAQDPRDLFDYAQVVLDYPAAAFVCALALGFQIHLAIPILQGMVISKRQRDTYGSSIVLFANAALAIACIITTTLYCVGFILMLQSLGQRPRVWPESPDHEPVTIDSPIFLTSGRRAILQMVAVGMQFMVLLADTLLIYRCWVIFNGKKWVYVIPSLPYAISLGLSVYGVVLSAWGNTSWEDFIAGELVAPYVSAVASFFRECHSDLFHLRAHTPSETAHEGSYRGFKFHTPRYPIRPRNYHRICAARILYRGLRPCRNVLYIGSGVHL
ncbi:hypothetical protein FA13DRAFT_96451 [Coprinellus micaceus]|uniref:Integral membrane protein n=1 Tax=Coprinellus micaceus TaxID=71717 RepID=A0A4Y7SIK1_COPMI|nr:hypothetical protein FA13DRAFT_96451 [Coprinellus micaceus]